MSAFSTQDQGQLLPYVAERHPNLFFDTAVPRYVPDILHAIRTVGAHRLVYGSDLYSVPTDLTADALPQLLTFPISDQEKASMLGDSARAVLGL
jgi:predicted TIM-barrel fold metal-dependent hydrolase